MSVDIADLVLYFKSYFNFFRFVAQYAYDYIVVVFKFSNANLRIKVGTDGQNRPHKCTAHNKNITRAPKFAKSKFALKNCSNRLTFGAK